MSCLRVFSVLRALPGRALGPLPALALALVLACGGAAPSGDENGTPPPTPGYPAVTSRLTLRLGGEFQKQCHATVIDPRWALTAAHCFSGVDPAARGALNELERSLSVSDVFIHPGALRSGAVRIEVVTASADFVAAHDFALVPVDPPLDTLELPARWLPEPSCTLPDSLDVRARFGQLGLDDRAQTAEATLLGTVSAESLLGPGHPGSLLSAQGPSVRPGDSGSGVLAGTAELTALASGCATSSERDEILIGVIQDANPDQPSLPFGLAPLHVFDHARWLARVIESGDSPEPPEPPRLDP
jgi:trypsin